MIIVKIELWPGGFEDHPQKRELQRIFIANVGGTAQVGSYDVVIPKSAEYAKRPGIWRKGRVTGFPRLRLGPADLLFRALAACVGDRNREVALGELGDEPNAEATA